MPSVIRAEHLSHRFGARAVLDDLTFSVRPGVVTGFLGPNGAGKTTTFSLRLGLLRPSGGRAEVLGLAPGDPRALAHIGALVESPALYDHLTGRENLEITRLLRQLPRSETDRVLGLVALSQDARRPVRDYSLGMRQRLGLALALLGDPRILLLDEPTNGLDPSGIQAMRDLLRALPRASGATVLLSSHLLSEVEQVAQDLVVIHRGRLRYQGPLSELGGEGAASLRVRVDAPEGARDLLRAAGFAWTESGEDVWIAATPEAGPAVADLLVRGGCGLKELHPRAVNLEARFLAPLEDA